MTTSGVDKKSRTHPAEISGRRVEFEPLYDHTGEYLAGVVVWDGHELGDVEALWWARVYLDGPYAEKFLSPHERYGDTLDSIDEVEAWPGLGDGTTRWVRRVWAYWYEIPEDGGGTGGICEPGELRWRESPEPGDGLRPALVVTLGGRP